MIRIIWEFTVKGDAIALFEQAYGPDGVWAVLFRAYPGYRGTTLLRDADNPRRFLTIDRWESSAQYLAMHEAARAEYARIDAECEGWTEAEAKIGEFRECALDGDTGQ